jgi:hypothetical protein
MSYARRCTKDLKRLEAEGTMKSIRVAALTCIVFASPMATVMQDSSANRAATDQGRPIMPIELLAALVGSWEGTCQTWFEPGKLADESEIKGEIRPLLEGRFLRHTYYGELQGKPRQGEETITLNSVTNHFQISWFDDFHMNYAIMFSEGEPTDRGFIVKGEYDTAPNAAPWGWKTAYELTDDDHLTITAYNITPAGQEAKAVEIHYVRRKQ